MDFFKQLAGIAGNIDLNMRIMSKGDSITVSILPATTDKLQPLTVTGTADELDSGLMDLVRKPLELVSGLSSNAAEFEAAVSKGLDKSAKKDEPKQKEKPAAAAPAQAASVAATPPVTELPLAAPSATANPAPPSVPNVPKPGPPKPAPVPA